MLDNLDPNEERSTPAASRPGRREPAPAQRITDREVPLRGRTTPASVQAWLDGELPESEVRRGDTAQDVEFWLRIDREVQTRRDLRTPVHVYQQIMDALPEGAPQLVEPWWRRSLTIDPLLALAAALGAAALGAILTAALLRVR